MVHGSFPERLVRFLGETELLNDNPSLHLLHRYGDPLRFRCISQMILQASVAKSPWRPRGS